MARSLLGLIWLLRALAASDPEGVQLPPSSSSSSSSSSSTVLQALHCPPCERVHCPPPRTLGRTCRGGVTTGVCGCCPTCAKLPGESCGGSWDHLGKCDQGLLCVHDNQDAAGGQSGAERKGVCKSVLSADACHPECTWEFCQANPHGICSARSVSLGRQECQGSCQHTCCSACLVLQPPRCPQTCAAADSSCLQNYGHCVQRHLAGTPHSPICHQDLQSNSEGFFFCVVPPCLNTVT